MKTIDLLSSLSARNRFLLVAAGALGLVIAGLGLGELLQLHPCPLCIFQRVLYLLLAAFALLGAVAGDLQKIRWGAAAAGIATAIGGISTAAYQTWMQLFPGSLMECGYSEPNLIERLVDFLGEKWEFMFLATGLCSSKEWTFLGLSMANWSIPCFAVLGGLLYWAARAKR